VDFGYSFSLEETFEKWGRDEIIGDFVRLIRMVRPDVILSMAPDGAGGGQHHQASAILAREAFRAAGDPSKYPEQLKDGLRPWQPKKFYSPVGRGGGPGGASPNAPARVVTVDLAAYDSLLGKTYAEIGTEARSMHKCQGMAQLLSLPGPSAGAFQLVESSITGQMQRDERSLFDNIDRSIAGLAQFAGPRAPKELTEHLSAIASAVEMAQKKFGTDGDEAALQPLMGGLRAVRTARGQLRGMPIDEAGRFEIDFRLRQKEKEFQQAILLANGIHVEALADDGVVVPGQPVRVSVIVASHGSSDVAIRQVKFGGFDGDAACTLTQVTGGGGAGGPGGRGGGAAGQGGRGRGAATPAATPISTLRKDQVARCDPTLRVRADERPSEPYWHRDGEAGRYTFDPDAPFGQPYRPTPFYVQVTLGFAGAAGEDVISGLPIQYRYEGNIFSGEKRSDVLVVPALSVRVSPEVAIVPTTAIQPAPEARPGSAPSRPAPASPDARPGQTASRQAPASPGARPGQTAPRPGPAKPAAPAGRSTPAPANEGREIRVTVVNNTKGPVESSVRLTTPPGWTSTPPEQSITFSREDEARTVRFQVRPAATTKSGAYAVGAVATTGGQDFRRGYQVIEYPHTRRQHIYRDADTSMKVLDVKTTPNLTVGYIMGVGDEVPPAIEQLGVKLEMIGADDLAWGDLTRFQTIVTGVRAYERRADLRANNEHAPVTIVARGDPVFTMPNEIADTAWEGWVQERGLYFLGERDPRYRDLVQLQDPFPYNAGEKRGALVETSYGKGRWVYVGLGLWRQLPAGVEGAYQLLANLISLKGS
jgi:hypothetical protein